MTAPPDRLAAALADRYRIERELGQGGMATVYLAEDLRHHRPVAIKVLRPELAATLGPARFTQEIEIAARLQHPHILPVHDSGEAGGFLFYVMPYVEGESLRERLAQHGELPIHIAVRLLIEVTDALAYAHGHGVVHRDIKPENIMLSGRHALVMDFGVAKAVSEASGRNKLTTAGVALGTPAYMAPEQASADPNLDQRVDIYALGVLGYELLAGRPPFTGATPQQILAAHVTMAPEPVATHRPTVSATLASVIMRALEKRPADRWQTAEEMLAQLEPLATPSGGVTPAETRPVGAVTPAVRRRWPLAAGVLLLAASGGIAWFAIRSRTPALAVANMRQVTREDTPQVFPRISPDGREVAYEAGTPRATHIEVRDVEGGRPVALTADWAGYQRRPLWLGDGRSILFVNGVSTRDHAAGWWKVPRLGGVAVRMDQADRTLWNGGTRTETEGDSEAFYWPDGRATRVSTAPISHSRVWRADGSALAYVVGNGDYPTSWGNVSPSAIWVLTAGHSPVQVTDSTSSNLSPAWLPDGSLVFLSDREGARDAYMLALTSSGATKGPPVPLTTGLGAYSISLSADGTRAAYDRLILRRNIYALPIPRAGSVSIREARPLTRGNQTVENMDLSGDGRWLAFDSNLEGNQDIYVMPASGGEPRRVTRNPGDDFSPDFSPDGREIVFHSARNANRDIYVINADGSGEQRLTTTAGLSLHPTVSPDGLAIAYCTNNRTIEVLRREGSGAPWGDPEQVLDSGFAPRWSPDGRSLAYDVRPGQGGIGVLRLGGKPRLVVPPGTAGLWGLAWPEWSADGSRIYFRARGADDQEGVYEVPAGGGTPRLLVRFDDPSRQPFIGSVLAGNGLFYFALGEIESDIYVMDLVRP